MRDDPNFPPSDKFCDRIPIVGETITTITDRVLVRTITDSDKSYGSWRREVSFPRERSRR